MKKEELIVRVTPEALHECSKVCKDFLNQQSRQVEAGGVMVGTFDGHVASVKQLLLDGQAACTPVSIHFSSSIFDEAEKLVTQHNKQGSGAWFILGTWHSHPPGYSNFSSTDEATLFREQMRLRTDDPSLAIAPWVHFIFSNYGLEPDRVKAFTMQLRSSYHLEETQLSTEAPLEERLADLVDNGVSLGLLVTTSDDQQWQLTRYHPDNFQMHLSKEIVIEGLWKYFPFPYIVHEFEKVFLENFCQKIQLQQFRYIRLLRQPDGNGRLIQVFECHRNDGTWELSKVIRFTELGIQYS